MIWIILILVILFIGVLVWIWASEKTNEEIKEMYDNDLKNLKRRGIIK